MEKHVKIGHLYPDLLNLYGDRGNIRCLSKRLTWRNIGAEVKEVHIDENVNFSEYDIVLLGGGSDREQKLVCDRLAAQKKEFKAFVEDGGVLIAICGGYQLLGAYYQIGKDKIQGLELVDMYTKQGEGRLIGNITIQSDIVKMPLTGFENHGGRTYLGDVEPLGKVIHGFGNNDSKEAEGVIYKNVVGTYLHGPLLPKNPGLSDYLLSKALERKYGDANLTPLDDKEELMANEYAQKLS